MKLIRYLLSAAASITLASAPAFGDETSPWGYEEWPDAMTDVVKVAASSSGPGVRAGFLCDPEGMRIFMAQTNFFDIEIGEYRTVTWRVDQLAPVRQTWVNNAEGGAYIQGDAAVSMARAVADARTRLVVQSGSDIVRFSVQGSGRTIERAFERCNIALSPEGAKAALE